MQGDQQGWKSWNSWKSWNIGFFEKLAGKAGKYITLPEVKAGKPGNFHPFSVFLLLKN